MSKRSLLVALISTAAAALALPGGATIVSGTSYFTVTPCRILDTRMPDGPFGGPALAPGEARTFAVTGICGIPANATDVALNVTVTRPESAGFLQCYAGDAPPPGTSLLNFAAGQTRANNAVVSLASDGSGTFAVRNASLGTAHVVVDVAGYFVTTCEPIAVSPATLPNGSTTAPYGQTITASGGTAPYAFTVTGGTLPPGLTLSTAGDLSGPPSQGGSYDFTVTATDAKGCQGSKDYTLVIDCPTISLTPAAGALADGLYGQLYALSAFTASGGAAPYSFAVTAGALPPGFDLASGGNLTSHTPTATGAFSFTVTATDAGGCTGSAAYTMTVRPVAAADSFGTGVGNTQFVVAAACPSVIPTPNVCVVGSVLVNDSGPGALSATLFSGPTNGSVALNANGTFTYTPNVGFAGPSDAFVYTLTDGNGATNAGTATVILSGRVWYVNNTGGSDSASRGRSHEPLATIGQAVTNASAGDTIFVHTGSSPYAGTTLGKSLTLWGQGTAFTLNGLTIAAGTKPVLSSTLTVAANSVTVSSLDLSTGAGTGITNSGTVSGLTVKNGVAVTTTTGTAVSFSNVDSTAGGAPANGVNFLSVSSNGGANGIVLSNVNVASGSFAVLGSGSAGTGGTIQNMTGADGGVAGSGIYLSNSKNVSLAWMQLHDFQNYAIRGINVTSFSLAQSTINGVNGTSASGDGEGSIYFDGLTGTGGISNSTVSGALVDNVHVASSSGTLTAFTVSGCTIADNSTASGNVGIQFLSKVSANMTVAVTNSTFHGNRTVALRGDAADASALAVTFTGNTIVAGSPNQGNQGIEISKAVTSNVTFTVDGNKIGTPDGTTPQPLINTGINVFSGSSAGTMSGTVTNNVVLQDLSSSNSGSGIVVNHAPTSTVATSALFARVSGNTVSGSKLNYGILVDSGGITGATGNTQVELTNNTVLGDMPTTALDSIRLGARRATTACYRISGNTATTAGTGFYSLFLRKSDTSTYQIEGLSAGLQSDTTTITYEGTQNPGIGGPGIGATAGNLYTGVAANTCSSIP
jgi:hypothetical protein